MNQNEDKMKVREIISNFLFSFRLMMQFYCKKFILQNLFNLLSTVASFLSYTYLLRYIVNALQQGLDYEVIFTRIFVVSLITIFVNILQQLYQNLLEPIIEKKSNAKFEKSLFKKSLEMDIESFELPQEYDLYSKAFTMGADAIKKTIDVISWIFSSVLELVMTSWIFLLIDPGLFIFALFPIIINIVDLKSENLWCRYDEREQEINRKKDYTRRIFYLADYAKEIRLTNIGKVMLKRFENATKEFLLLIKHEGLKKAIVSFTIDFGIQGVSILGAEAYALFRTLVSKTMLYGDCFVVLNSIGKISWNVMNFGQMFVSVYEIALNVRSYRLFLCKQPRIAPNISGDDIVEGDLTFSNVSFCYCGTKKEALSNISMTIPQGKKVAIVGENGAGKTTLIKLLMRLYEVSDGMISVGNKDIRSFKLESYRSMFAVVFQDFHHLSVSVAESILGKPYMDTDEQVVIDALKKSGAWEFVSKLPNGIHTVINREIDENGVVFSHGQSQKLAIAAIYARKCSTIILDEPTSALDPIAEYEMYERLAEACKGKTILFISHRMSSVVDADIIFVLEKGKIIERGTHSELLTLGGKYSKMFNVQAQNYISDLKG